MTTNLIAEVETLRNQLTERKTTIFAAAARHINPERFTELIARACIQNPQLLDCTRPSLVMAAASAAALGLEIDGVLGHAYLVPFKNHGALEAVLIPGYKGLKELAYRSEKIAIFRWGIVRDGDEFDYRKGTDEELEHVPRCDPDKEWTFVWALAETTKGGRTIEVMSRKQVEAHRNKYVPKWKRAGSAWLTNPEAMALKTVMLKLFRLLPLSPEIQRIVENAEYEHLHTSESSGIESGDTVPAENLDAIADAIEQKDTTTITGEVDRAASEVPDAELENLNLPY